MAKLTVSGRGQVTLRKEVLQHLGVKAGDEIVLDLLPDGSGVIKAVKPAGALTAFFGLLQDRTHKVATLDEINDAAARGWANRT